MKLQYLTLCLLGLSLGACTQHVIKTSPDAAKSAGQRAIHGLNSMLETSSYDYRGQFLVKASALQDITKTQEEQKKSDRFDHTLQKQIDQFLKKQHISLTTQQKQQLYQAMDKEADRYRAASTVSGRQFDVWALNLLSNIQFDYAGSVHYRQKLASLNLTATYKKPTLLVQAKIPMVVDFKDYKFYSNYFALMPYLVNQDSQSSFAYIDFSKYKSDINKVNLQELAEYFKQMNAVAYLLAEPQQIHSLALTAQDRQQGLVEKVRLDTTLEAISLQSSLFSQLNKGYLSHTVLGMPVQSKDNQIATDAAREKDDFSHKVELDILSSETGGSAETEAYQSRVLLTQLVNEHLNQLQRPDMATDSAVETSCITDSHKNCRDAAQLVEDSGHLDTAKEQTYTAAEEEASGYLTKEECQTLLQQSQQIAMGQLNACRNEYGLDAFQKNVKDKGTLYSLNEALLNLQKVFTPYEKQQLTTAEEFTGLWKNHQSDIQQAMKGLHRQTPLQVDVGLDQQGRVVQIKYGLQYTTQKYGVLNIKADMDILNYGNATKIDRAQLRNAKSIEEVSKGSMFENLIKGLGRSMGEDESSRTHTRNEMPDFEQQVHKLAEKTYARTHSYQQTYQTVFLMELAVQQPELLKNYSPQALQEISQVYAYRYQDVDQNTPDTQELAKIKILQEKHQLKESIQFDEVLGKSVDKMVSEVITDAEDRQNWNKLATQYKQPQALFIQYYIQRFNEEYEVEPASRPFLKAAATVLARAYKDTTQNNLSVKSIQQLTLDQADYIDFDLYQETYQKLKQHVK